MSDIFGSSKDTSVSYLPEQIKDIQQTGQYRTGMQDFAKNYLNQLQGGYNDALAGINKAAQGGAGYAGKSSRVAKNIYCSRLAINFYWDWPEYRGDDRW